MSGVPVLLAWDAASLAEAGLAGLRAVHVLTNSRAFPPARARELVREAAEAAVGAAPEARLLLRGDSTLRGHVLEEYEAVRDVAFPDREPVLLLVPALPSAGRVTIDGVHLLQRDGRRVPLHETEYARDAAFGYADARLLQWAEDRSAGLLARADGAEIPLAELRAVGPERVASALLELAAAGRPAACVPDVETLADLELVAEGLRGAEERDAAVIVRSGPAFAGVLAGTLAPRYVPPPPAPHGLVVLCGSYVPATTRQLERLERAHPGCLVEADVAALASEEPAPEIERLAGEALSLVGRRRLAVVSTPRDGPAAGATLESGERVARSLAGVLTRLDPLPDVVVTKGGITSAVAVADGLGAKAARVVGPLVDGVSLWEARSSRGRVVPTVVFPGNVGHDGSLLEVVDLILAA